MYEGKGEKEKGSPMCLRKIAMDGIVTLGAQPPIVFQFWQFHRANFLVEESASTRQMSSWCGAVPCSFNKFDHPFMTALFRYSFQKGVCSSSVVVFSLFRLVPSIKSPCGFMSTCSDPLQFLGTNCAASTSTCCSSGPKVRTAWSENVLWHIWTCLVIGNLWSQT